MTSNVRRILIQDFAQEKRSRRVVFKALMSGASDMTIFINMHPFDNLQYTIDLNNISKFMR